MQQFHNGWPHHFTASALVICRRHLLLVNHKRIGAWVPPGGHIEETEMPDECVVREVLEETGVQIEILSPPAPPGDAEAFFLPSPLYMQAVPAVEKGQQYYHVDIAYLCRPTTANELDGEGLPLLRHDHEIERCRWVPREEIAKLPLARNVDEAVGLLDSVARQRGCDW